MESDVTHNIAKFIKTQSSQIWLAGITLGNPFCHLVFVWIA